MNKKGPIVLIDDDQDDLHLLIEIFAEFNLPNEIHLFKSAESLLAFLRKPGVDPFLIISDINMPVTNGFRLRDQILADPGIDSKTIPYIFFTTSTTLRVSSNGSGAPFQGIFKKPTRHSEWKETLMSIVRYWTLSMPPDEYEF
ncbi:MAG: response regulator [Chitinophagaceae bacterium]|nr:response regulator [Chitinophagaceae bacterium]